MKDILTISRKIFIKENKLTINNKIKIKNLYIVLLDSDRDIEYGDSSFDRNIIAFNESFEPIWCPVRTADSLIFNGN
ncbi:hypothetical protein QJU96_00155 [Pasteurella skyensis]|uniref:hypothetical protein n=1 Tax=Phocoenobacter skyensis TaxID=97481 RepID=UPI002794EF87|nr:hypothetical protein [Pasteurella skyensis]MDP8169706.1 hypothetical protein [Pasteurella skyensis]